MNIFLVRTPVTPGNTAPRVLVSTSSKEWMRGFVRSGEVNLDLTIIILTILRTILTILIILTILSLRLDFQQLSVGYSSSSPTGCVSGTTDYLSFSTPVIVIILVINVTTNIIITTGTVDLQRAGKEGRPVGRPSLLPLTDSKIHTKDAKL